MGFVCVEGRLAERPAVGGPEAEQEGAEGEGQGVDRKGNLAAAALSGVVPAQSVWHLPWQPVCSSVRPQKCTCVRLYIRILCVFA